MQFEFVMKQGEEIIAKGVASAVLLYKFQEALVQVAKPVVYDPSGSEPAFSEVMTMKVGEYRIWKAISEDMQTFTFSCERIADDADYGKAVPLKKDLS